MIKYIEQTPSADEFNYLTNSVGWGIREKNIIEEALKNTLYSLCVYDNDKLMPVNDEKALDMIDEILNHMVEETKNKFIIEEDK